MHGIWWPDIQLQNGHFLKGILRRSHPAFIFSSNLFTLTRIKIENPYQRIRRKWTPDRGNYVVVVTEIFLSFRENIRCKKTAVSPKEIHCFNLPKSIEQIIWSKVVFFQSKASGIMPHLDREYISYKILPWLKSWFFANRVSCLGVAIKWRFLTSIYWVRNSKASCLNKQNQDL